MSTQLRIAICLFFCCNLFTVYSQQIRINEVVSSNSTFYDEDGDSPDWFELHNPTQNAVSLEGWTITDKEEKPDKWTMPAITLQPDEYIYIWASGKDINNINYPRTIINRNEEWKYIIPAFTVTLEWIDVDFNDSNWLNGNTGFGYSDNDDITTIPSGTVSVFMRKQFDITDKSLVDELILDIDYDDAFVAYINGVEIARANIDGDRPSFNDYSITDHEAQIYNGGRPDRFTVAADVLQDGKNVLSIQAHNVSAFSSDFTLIPFLSAMFSGSTNEGTTPPQILNLGTRLAHTNFKISNGETLFLYDDNGNEIDKLFVGNTPPDISLGRRKQDQALVLFDPPTPGQENEGDGYEGFLLGDIEFSHPGGVVNNQQLVLSGGGAQDVIRYTLDATIPDDNSPVYNNPIPIIVNTIVRARIFREGFIPSLTQSKTYLRNVSHDIPIVSLVTDPKNLFDNDIGIYELGDNYNNDFPFFGANFWEDWERQINFTLFEEDNSLGINFDAGVKIFGGWSRAMEQRSFSIFARGKYGTSEIDYPLFASNPYQNYQALVLRNSGNDFLRSNIRDGVLTTLMDGSGIETQAFRPVASYINGAYWGMYNMREKVNEHFLASRHHVNPDEIDLMGPLGELIHGDDSEYIALHEYLEIHSPVAESKYQFVKDRIDIENFIIYNIAQIYFDNTDWPGNNIKYWKTKNGKWRWILYDTDFGFGVWNPGSYSNNTLSFAIEPNGPGWPNPPYSTLLLRRLVKNENFKRQFINQFADEMNSRFLPDRVEEHIEGIADIVSAEINKHYNRWGGDINFHHDQVTVMKNFAKFRPFSVKSHLRSEFNLPATRELTLQINNPTAGYIKLNSLTITNPFWQGDYFQSVPIKLTAVARPGYTFSHWDGDNPSTEPELIVDMQAAMTINAIFETSTEEQTVVINEINYNSPEFRNSEDWIELYNPNEAIVDLSEWTFTELDEEGGYHFPIGTFIKGNDFLILTRNRLKFEVQYPDVENVIGNFNFGLSNQGDNLRIYNKDGELMDSVQYSSSDPWPEMADGLGYTLELIAPNLDNALAENWTSFEDSGSAGLSNGTSTSIKEENIVANIIVYPNPFIENAIAEVSIDKPSDIKLTLKNANGSMVKKIFEGKKNSGRHIMKLDFANLNSGLYFLKVVVNGNVQTFKLIRL